MSIDGGEKIVVGIEGYLVDITNFIDHHPGSKRKILRKIDEVGAYNITRNFIDHFGHTVRLFRQKAKEFDQKGDGKPVIFCFNETPNYPVQIIGRL